MARRVQSDPTMTMVEELRAVDAEWDEIAVGAEERPPGDGAPEGTFGHASERRLGLRVPAGCWALLSDGEQSTYARTVELSPTSAVLKLIDGRTLRFDGRRSFTLDIFVPNTDRPVHATARPARSIGELQAFELSGMDPIDRLTLAEHLDDVVTQRPNRRRQSSPPSEHAAGRPSSPPVSWRNFVLSLKRPKGAGQAAPPRL